MSQSLRELMLTATINGILPADTPGESIPRPWPIILLTGLGAWLAVIPLTAAIFLMTGDRLLSGSLSYTFGLVFLIGAVVVLRDIQDIEFLEQLAIPVLLVGGVLLAFSLQRDLPAEMAGIMLTAICVGVAWAIPRTWLRTLLGALACAAFITIFSERGSFYSADLWNGMHAALLAWGVAAIYSDTTSTSYINADSMITLESWIGGWGVTLLASFAFASGQTFIVGTAIYPWHNAGLADAIVSASVPRMVSVTLAVAGTAVLAYHWPAIRTPRALLAAALLTTLCWLMPLFGGMLLVLAMCASSGRRLLAIAASVSAVWIVGSFYYQLDLPLSGKALIMALAGAAFGLIAWLGSKGERKTAIAIVATSPKRLLGLAVSLTATLVVANGAIWQKEDLIRNGRSIFIELAPADPRSLMQGDYMALNFSVPYLHGEGRHIKVIAKIDTRGVAAVERIADDQLPGRDEIMIELLRTQRGLRPATDAWYFKEGEARRWEKARYGEFRIGDSGSALLVGLRGAQLEKL